MITLLVEICGSLGNGSSFRSWEMKKKGRLDAEAGGRNPDK